MGCLPCKYNKVEYDKFFYSLAESFAKKGNLPDALKCYCDTFLVRASEPDLSQDWLTFYNVQFTSYLLGKRRLGVMLPEGDMIYQLIRDTWLDVKVELSCSPISLVRNLFEWSKTVEIDFPFELDCFGDFDDFSDQNDSDFEFFSQVG